MNSQRLGQHAQGLHRSKPDEVPTLGGKSGYNPNGNQETISNSQLFARENFVFFNGVSLSTQTTLKKASHPAIDGQPQINSMAFWGFFSSHIALFGYFPAC